MSVQSQRRSLVCGDCADGHGLGFEISMAFQPIVDAANQTIFGHEALVRGTNNESAGEIFNRVNDSNLYKFDQACRSKAIEHAARLGISNYLSINFLPNAVYQPELCIQATLRAAERFEFPIENIIFEFTEGEKVISTAHLRRIVEYYQSRGFKTAIDDFGAGFAGLNLLADIQTDYVKIDMELIRGIDRSRARRVIVKNIVELCRELGITTIAEGIESQNEFLALRSLGIDLFQGYYFARPAFESLAHVSDTSFRTIDHTPMPATVEELSIALDCASV